MFRLVNESQATAHVYLRSGCGCTTLDGEEFSLEPRGSVDIPVEMTSAIAGRRATFVSVHVVPDDKSQPYEFDVQIVADVQPACRAEVVDSSWSEDGLPTFRIRLVEADWADIPNVVGAHSNFAVFDAKTDSIDGRRRSVRLTATRRLDGFANGDAAVISLLTDSAQVPSIDVPVPARLPTLEFEP